MDKLVTIWKRELLRDARIYEGNADEREAHPRFGGDDKGQRLWLGRSEANTIAELRRRARIMRETAATL